MKVTTQPGSFAECTFTGSGIRWVGHKYDDAGRTKVTLDGKVVTTVDQYDSQRGLPFRYEIRDLPRGRHTLRLTALPNENAASKGRYINIISLDVLAAED